MSWKVAKEIPNAFPIIEAGSEDRPVILVIITADTNIYKKGNVYAISDKFNTDDNNIVYISTNQLGTYEIKDSKINVTLDNGATFIASVLGRPGQQYLAQQNALRQGQSGGGGHRRKSKKYKKKKSKRKKSKKRKSKKRKSKKKI